MNALIREIIWFWQRRHNPMCALPEWREGNEIERRGHRTGCTQAVGRGRKVKRQAVHAALSRKVVS